MGDQSTCQLLVYNTVLPLGTHALSYVESNQGAPKTRLSFLSSQLKL